LFGSASTVGEGTMSVFGRLMLRGASVISGVGSLSSSAIKMLLGQLISTGTSSFSVIGRLILYGQSTMAGIGNMSLSAIRMLLGALSTAGTGFLSAIGTLVGDVIQYGSALLSGIGSLDAVGYMYKTGQAMMSGVGNLTSNAIGIFRSGASLAGKGLTYIIGRVRRFAKSISMSKYLRSH